MKFLTLILLTYFCLTLAQANTEANIGFKNGNDISIINLSGNLTAICPSYGGPSLANYYNCSGYISEPSSYDYFSHPAIDADSVQLTSEHEDGDKQTKKAGFNGSTGLSTKKVNLTTSTLLQKPLLDYGENKVTYELSKNKQIVKTGHFIATKTLTESRRCRPRTLHFSSENSCRDQYYVCDAYFADQNNCK